MAATPDSPVITGEARDRAAVQEAVLLVARAADLRQWAVVRALFANPMVLDYGTPERLTPEAVVDRWSRMFVQFDATEHRIGDVRVTLDGDRAQVESAFRADHLMRGAQGGDRWTLEGRYEHDMMRGADGWTITRMRMIAGAQSGNVSIPGLAQQRAAISPALTPGANRITFTVAGDRVVGTLFLPPKYRAGDRLPLVLVDGPWTQVKEQVGYRYGRLFAAGDLAAFAIDHRGWGESGGTRSYESFALKVEDLKAAITALADLEAVDGNRIGVLGVCAGAGVTARVAAEDSRVRAYGTVAAWLQFPATTPQFYGGAEGVAARIALAERARERFERTGEVDYVKAYDPADGSGAAMFFPLEYYGDPARGAIPQWRNEFAVMGWREWLELDALPYAPRIRVPSLMIHSDGSALPENVRRFFDSLATPAEHKRLVWTEGEHTQFYDREEQVTEAARQIVEFFRQTLGR